MTDHAAEISQVAEPDPHDSVQRLVGRRYHDTDKRHGSALLDYGHLMDYVLDLHIIIGPNGMCRCGEDGITCSERLRRVSHEISSALLGANMAKSMGAEKWTSNEKLTHDGTQRRLPPPVSNDNTQNENGGSRSLE